MTHVVVGDLILRLGTARPTWDLWCMGSDGDPLDYSTGYTFGVVIRQAGTDHDITATVTVTANGSPTGDGQDANHVPTFNIAPTVATLAGLRVGSAKVVITATTGGLPAEHEFDARIRT